MSVWPHFLVAVLFNSLWQGPLVALFTWLCLRAAPKSTASTRYLVWSIALVAATILPFVTANVQIFTVRQAHTAAPAISTRVTAPSMHAPLHVKPAQQSPAFAVQRPRIPLAAPISFAITIAWSCIAALLLLRLLAELVRLEAFKRDALPLPFEYRDVLARWTDAKHGSDARVCVSPHTDVPVAIGLFDAMILLPQDLLHTLGPVELEHIALHELGHLRRHDDWANALERLAVTFFFFNPAIRWIAAQMDLEREVACDDYVVQLTHEVRPYAHCLTKMAEATQWPRHALAAPGVFITRKSVSIRIERLLRARSSERMKISYAPAFAAIAAVVLLFAGSRVAGPVFAAALGAPEQHDVTRRVATHTVRKISHVTPSPVSSPKVIVVIATPHAVPSPVVHVPRKVSPPHHVRVPKAASPHVTRGVLPQCDGCNLAGVDWRGRDLRGIVLHGANLADADLRDADLRDADLSGSNLRGARFGGAKLQGAKLSGIALTADMVRSVDLSQVQLSGDSVDAAGADTATLRTLLNLCTGCSFAGLDVRGKDLSGLRIVGIDLQGLDFRGTDLRNTTFSGVNLERAQFQGAQLNGTTFAGCNLAGVDFRGVDVSGARFTGSNLSDTTM